MNEDSKRWFIEKVAQNPEYLGMIYIPALETERKRAEYNLRQANRNGTLEMIKYNQGWLDGVDKIMAVLDGLKLSERKTPAAPGLMERIFGGGLRPDDNG